MTIDELAKLDTALRKLRSRHLWRKPIVLGVRNVRRAKAAEAIVSEAVRCLDDLLSTERLTSSRQD